VFRPYEHVDVPHRSVSERGVGRVGEPGSLEEHYFDLVFGEDVYGLMQQLLELQHLHHRNSGESPQLLVRRGFGVSANATKLPQQNGRGVLVLGKGAQLLPVDSRAQRLAHGGIAWRYSRRQQQELDLGGKCHAASRHTHAQR
jgi:hypothetical protein